MICKERDKREHSESGKFASAGAKAEEQMAFYLKRAFRDDPEVWIFNDLRFRSDEDDVAQIDHLVMHRSGFILIESKSVTSKVRIHENGEWERLWNKDWQGISSPIKQVERQVAFLRAALQAYRDQLLGKFMFGKIQMGFGNVPFEILVAISDDGSIDRKGNFPQVTKADLIPDLVRAIVKRHKKARALFSLNNFNLKSTDGVFNFKAPEIEAMRRWFIEHYYPQSLESKRVVQVQPTAPPAPVLNTPLPSIPAFPAKPSAPVSVAGLGRCQKCSAQAVIVWGKFGYYWKCPSCGGNTPIKEYCPKCLVKMKFRKDKERYYKHCDVCKTPEVLYWQQT